MSKSKFVSEFNVGGGKLAVGLTILLWKEGKIHYALSPSLDLMGYGKTEQEAKDSFEVVLNEFIRYTHSKKTIYQELERLGWLVNKKKKRVVAPDVFDLLSENEDLKQIVQQDYKRYDRTLELAL